MKRQTGFTLIELLVSIAVMSMVIVYLTRTFTTQHQAYTVVDQVTEVQNNLRAISQLLEREIRHTGFLVPEAAAVCGADALVQPDVLFLTDSGAIDPTSAAGNELGAVIQSGFNGGPGNTDTLNFDPFNAATVEGQPFYDNDGDGLPDTDFQQGGGVIIVDRANPDRGAVCGRILGAPTPASMQVNYLPLGGHTLGPMPLGGNPEELVAIPAHIYLANAPTAQLIRNGNVLAEGVEDLQFAFFYDIDGDGIVDSEALEYPGSPGGAVYQSDQWNNEELREVRVSLVLRSADPDPEYTQGEFQTTENRQPPIVGANDGFRRRVLQPTVRLRNVGNR